MLGLRGFEQCISLARMVILARLLSPADFGLFGISMLILVALDVFTQTGFQQGIVQRADATDKILDTAWTVLFLRALLISAIMIGTAPLIAGFFKAPEATNLIIVLGILPLLGAGGIGGFACIGVVRFQRNLVFGREFIWRLSGLVADVSVAIYVAVIYQSAWALVVGVLAGNIVRLIMGYLLSGYIARPRWNLMELRQLWQYGKWMTGISIVIYTGSQLVDIVVGKRLGTAMLGYYQMGFKLGNLPASDIAQVISPVTFPALARLNGAKHEQTAGYFRSSWFILALCLPAATVLVTFAQPITVLLLTSKWLEIVPVIQIIGAASIFSAVATTGSSLFLATGKPAYEFLQQTARAIVTACLIFPLIIWYGLSGAGWTVFFSMVVTLVAGLSFIAIVTKPSLRDIMNLFLSPFAGAALMAGMAGLLITYLDFSIMRTTASIISFIGSLLLLGIVYCAAVYVIERFILKGHHLSDLVLIGKTIFAANKVN